MQEMYSILQELQNHIFLWVTSFANNVQPCEQNTVCHSSFCHIEQSNVIFFFFNTVYAGHNAYTCWLSPLRTGNSSLCFSARWGQ